MKIAIGTRRFTRIARHAGQTREWLVFDAGTRDWSSRPARVVLSKAQLPHHFRDDGPHPLDGIEILVTGSAGDGFVRRMAKRGTKVLVTGETEPRTAAEKVARGEALAKARFNPGTLLCKIHDLFSTH